MISLARALDGLLDECTPVGQRTGASMLAEISGGGHRGLVVGGSAGQECEAFRGSCFAQCDVECRHRAAVRYGVCCCLRSGQL